MAIRTIRAQTSEIRRPMAAARSILKTKYGNHGTCRLRWNAARGIAEAVATDFGRIGRMEFRATTSAEDFDRTFPFEGVRAIANWREATVAIVETSDGVTISSGAAGARRQNFACERRYDGPEIDRVLRSEDIEGRPVEIERARARRVVREEIEEARDGRCLITVGSDGVRVWSVNDNGTGREPAGCLSTEPAGIRIASLVARKDLADALRSMTGRTVRVTQSAVEKFLRLTSRDGDSEFVLEAWKPERRDGGRSGHSRRERTESA